MVKIGFFATLVAALALMAWASPPQDPTTQSPSSSASTKQKNRGTAGGSQPTDQNQHHSAHTAQTQSGLSHSDHHFVMEAAQGGKMEVDLGQLALQRASSDDVKRFAQRMVDDHSKANQELMTLASSKGVSLPPTMTGSTDTPATTTQAGRPAGTSTGTREGRTDKQQAMMDRLSRLSGADFDRAYMKHMVQDHDKDVAAFQREASQGKDPEVKAWASNTLPTLREHQQMAHEIYAKLGHSTKSGKEAKTKTNTTPETGAPSRP